MKSTYPTIPRDTRVLLTIVVISVAALWALARLRFPDRPQTSNPVPPVLAQLAPQNAFDDIVSVVAQLETRLQLSIVRLEVERRSPATAGVSRATVSALRFRDDLGVALFGAPADSDPTVIGASEVARDRASQLVVVRLPGEAAPGLATWAARRPLYPRFFVAADASPRGVSLRPIFIGSLHAVVTPIWPDPLWALPDRIDLAPGTFVFTVDGALAGLVVDHDGGRALAPADAVITIADRMSRETQKRPGHLGVEVQPLDARLAAATGGSTGVVVTWVDPQGAAARALKVTDIVESIDGRPAPTLAHWTARIARLAEGESLVIGVRRGGTVRDVPLVAQEASGRGNRPLGLELRTIPGVGTEILRMEPDALQASSDLRVGDVLTVVGEISAPNARQVSRAFAAASREHPLLVALTRAGTHHVLALERTW